MAIFCRFFYEIVITSLFHLIFVSIFFKTILFNPFRGNSLSSSHFFTLSFIHSRFLKIRPFIPFDHPLPFHIILCNTILSRTSICHPIPSHKIPYHPIPHQAIPSNTLLYIFINTSRLSVKCYAM